MTRHIVLLVLCTKLQNCFLFYGPHPLTHTSLTTSTQLVTFVYNSPKLLSKKINASDFGWAFFLFLRTICTLTLGRVPIRLVAHWLRFLPCSVGP